MSVRRVVSRRPLAQLLRATIAALLAALALPAFAAQGSLLEITVGPHETKWLQIKELKVTLDGAPLEVALPAPGADPAAPIYSEAIKPGAHHVDVEAGFIGDSKAFSYVEGYVFRMKGGLDIEGPAGEAVGVNIKAITVSGLTIEWTDRQRLALRSTRYSSDKAVAARVPDEPPPSTATAAKEPEPQPEPEKPTAQPVPATYVERAGAGACNLEPPRFQFAKHDLDATARARLDEFAACVVDSGDTVLIEGHADPRGTAAYNERLSGERATQVVDYLAKKGVARSRLSSKACGFTRLLCEEKTGACYARNRRAEAIVSKP